MVAKREIVAALGLLLIGIGCGYYGGIFWCGGDPVSSTPGKKATALASVTRKKVPLSPANEQLKDSLLRQAHDKDDPLRELSIGKAVLAMDAATVQQVLESLPVGIDEDTRLLQQALVARWAHLDPAAAMDYAKTHNGGNVFMRDNLKYMVLKAWGDTDPVGALGAMADIRQKNRWMWSSDGGEAVKNMLDHLGGADGRGAFDWAKANLGSPEYSVITRDICQYLAEIDPQQAAALVSQLPPSQDYGSGRRSGIDAVASAWAEKDTNAAIAWAQTLGALDRPEAYQSILRHWNEDDPKGGAMFFLKMPQWMTQRMWMGDALTSWVSKDPKAAAEWVKQLPEGAMKKKANDAYLSALSQIDPKAAADHILTLPASDLPMNAIWQIGFSLGEEDRGKALEWVHKLPDKGYARNNATQNIYSRWADEDPKEAMEYIMANETGNIRESALNTVGASWVRNDPQAALEYVKGISDNEARSSAMNSLLSSWSDENPKEAAALAATLPESIQVSAIPNIARNWAESDMAAAATWASTLPEGKSKVGAYQAMTENWMRYDSDKAVAWVQTLPQGAARDAAVVSATNQLVSDDPAASARLAVTIGDEKQRDQSVQNVVANWIRTDAEAAKAWVNGSGLPQEQKDKLLKIR